MTRIVLALGLSIALHGLFGEMAARWVDPRPSRVASVDVEVLPDLIVLPPPAAGVTSSGHATSHRLKRTVVARRSASPALAAAPPASADIAPARSSSDEAGSASGAADAEPVVGSIPGGTGERDLGAFVERLRQSARRCSPRRTGAAGETSLARVRFCVDSAGRPEAVTLLQSSGDARLDRAALECVIPGAAPLPTSDRCLVVPLRFSL